jgi:replication-associated recombination protein RarA
VLKPLGDHDMLVLIARVQARALAHIRLDEVAIAMVMCLAAGDARRCLNLLEQLRAAADALVSTPSTRPLLTMCWRRTRAASTRAATTSAT